MQLIVKHTSSINILKLGQLVVVYFPSDLNASEEQLGNCYCSLQCVQVMGACLFKGQRVNITKAILQQN